MQMGTEFVDISEKDCDRMFDTNLKAVMNISQSAAKNMIAGNRKGSILNISSGAALRAAQKQSTYCTSKAALDMLTKCMALELGKHSIRVNAVNLGVVKTFGMVKNIAVLGDKADAEFGPVKAKMYDNDLLPMDDVVNTMLFTASDLSCTLTGSCIVMDGGLTLS